MKTCVTCNETKPKTDFNGYACKKCYNKAKYDRIKSSPEALAKQNAAKSKFARDKRIADPKWAAEQDGGRYERKVIQRQDPAFVKHEYQLEKAILEANPERKAAKIAALVSRNAKRLKNDPEFFIKQKLRGRFRDLFKVSGITKNNSFVKRYRIDFKAIFDRLGPRPGPTFTIDHIIPLAMFDITNRYHVFLAHLPENLRWMEAGPNSSKGKKLDKHASVKILEKLALL